MSAHTHATSGPVAGEREFHPAHHFPDAKTQFDANRMGIWLFLAQEVLFFSGLFCAFFIYRAWYFDAFVEAHHHLDKVMGAVNTLVLLTSSLTMALAVRAAQTSNKRATSLNLLLTIAFAFTFMVVKYFEYSHKIHDGLLPGKWFTAAGFAHPEANIFFAIYFMMTGVHGLHVLIGIGLLFWLWLRNQRGDFWSQNYAAVEGVGLYWHLVDLVWIFLFPLLYLVG